MELPIKHTHQGYLEALRAMHREEDELRSSRFEFEVQLTKEQKDFLSLEDLHEDNYTFWARVDEFRWINRETEDFEIKGVIVPDCSYLKKGLKYTYRHEERTLRELVFGERPRVLMIDLD